MPFANYLSKIYVLQRQIETLRRKDKLTPKELKTLERLVLQLECLVEIGRSSLSIREDLSVDHIGQNILREGAHTGFFQFQGEGEVYTVDFSVNQDGTCRLLNTSCPSRLKWLGFSKHDGLPDKVLKVRLVPPGGFLPRKTRVFLPRVPVTPTSQSEVNDLLHNVEMDGLEERFANLCS